MSKKGIDVSKWQGNIDWEKVAEFGIDFAMIKAGGADAGYYTDRKFFYNYDNAKAAGVNVGAYFFAGSDFYGTEKGIQDAEYFLSIIEGLVFEYPIALDIECTAPERKREATDAAIAFCEYLENAGYYVMIYGSDISTFRDRLDNFRLSAYDHWVAKYSNTYKPKYCPQYGIWQNSNRGYCAGIEGQVDIDISYYDYPAIMEKNKLNGMG